MSSRPLPRPLSRLPHPREAVRRFTPNWFAATMGTGVLALALKQFPGDVPGLAAVAYALWRFDVALFLLCTILYAARWLFWFDEARRIFGHGAMSLALGTIPMGLATIANGALAFHGDAAVPVANVLWWLDAALSLACAAGVPFLMFTRQSHRLEDMTAAWLLPVVAAEVCAAEGGQLVAHLAPGAEANGLLFASYALWGVSMLPALGILAVLFLRLVLHRLPGPDAAASNWLALGPVATGALGLLVLGEQAGRVLAGTPLADVGAAAHGLGLVGALALWGCGAWWFALALLATLRAARAGLPFNLGWWAFTFPLGVYALATLALGRATGVEAFDVAGGALVVLLAAAWTIVAARTLHGSWLGHLFSAPCLSQTATAANDPSQRPKLAAA